MPQRTLRLISETQDDRPIYVAGTFNDWTTGLERFRLHATPDPGVFSITLDFPEGTEKIEYKFTR
ncbi:MAG: hypothetical protein AAF597_02860, partial [Bacteroidota bacterium]